MPNYLTSGDDLFDVARAIRKKYDLNTDLSFPEGFVRAITSGPDPKTFLFGATGFGDVEFLGTTLRGNLYGSDITSFCAPNATTIGPKPNSTGRDLNFAACTALTTVRMPLLRTTFKVTNLFENCTSLSTVDLRSLATVPDYCFKGCTALKRIVLPNLDETPSPGIGWGNIYTEAFMNAGLETCDLGGPSIALSRQRVFKNCPLQTLILRRAGTVTPLANINNFDGTPFALDGSGGTLYVPSALISAYEQETNWSVILGYPNNQILAIESSAYETHYADGTEVPTT